MRKEKPKMGEPWGHVFDGLQWHSLNRNGASMDRFDLEENAILDASLYRTWYENCNTTTDRSITTKQRAQLWEMMVRIMRSRGMKV